MNPHADLYELQRLLQNRVAIQDAVDAVVRERYRLMRGRIRRLKLPKLGPLIHWPRRQHDAHMMRWRNALHEARERRRWRVFEAGDRVTQEELAEAVRAGKIHWSRVVYKNGTDEIVRVL